MHIFQNIKTPEQFRLEKEIAIAKKRGVSLEGYRAIKKKEYEDECQRIHQEELKRLGLSEDEYQKKEKQRLQKEKIHKYVKGALMAICIPLVLFLLYYGIPYYLSSTEIGKDVLLIVGITFVIGLVMFYLGTPVFLIIWEFLGKVVGNRYLKLILGIMITILIVGFLLYTCGVMGDGGAGTYEPGKLRPDKF